MAAVLRRSSLVFDLNPEIPEKGNNETLTAYMDTSFFKKPQGEKSLHDKVVELPFYTRLLRSKEITPQELLQHFVNNSAIFGKLETIVKTEVIFQQVIGEDLYRPPITQETLSYLDYMDETLRTDPRLIIAILYTQYGGLFIGRAVRTATIEWLENKLRVWDQLPLENRGVSYWDFEGQTTADQRAQAKDRMISSINRMDLTHLSKRLWQVTREAFEHNFKRIQSESPLKVSTKILPLTSEMAFGALLFTASILAIPISNEI
jgi:hypothetical protein